MIDEKQYVKNLKTKYPRFYRDVRPINVVYKLNRKVPENSIKLSEFNYLETVTLVRNFLDELDPRMGRYFLNLVMNKTIRFYSDEKIKYILENSNSELEKENMYILLSSGGYTLSCLTDNRKSGIICIAANNDLGDGHVLVHELFHTFNRHSSIASNIKYFDTSEILPILAENVYLDFLNRQNVSKIEVAELKNKRERLNIDVFNHVEELYDFLAGKKDGEEITIFENEKLLKIFEEQIPYQYAGYFGHKIWRKSYEDKKKILLESCKRAQKDNKNSLVKMLRKI